MLEVRLSRNHSEAVVVTMGLTIQDLHPDLTTPNVLELVAWINLEWTDEFLVWKPSEYKGRYSNG